MRFGFWSMRSISSWLESDRFLKLAAANPLTNDALDPESKISEYEFCAVKPAYTTARVGDNGGPLPPVPAQFDAIPWASGPNCDVRIGAVPATFSVGNLDVESVFSDEGITEGDLRAGKYNFAEVRMFLVNFQDLAQGILKLRRGWLGEVTIRDGMYVAELRGMTQRLQMTVGEVYAPDYAADFGDARCGVDLVALEESGTVTAVTGDPARTLLPDAVRGLL